MKTLSDKIELFNEAKETEVTNKAAFDSTDWQVQWRLDSRARNLTTNLQDQIQGAASFISNRYNKAKVAQSSLLRITKFKNTSLYLQKAIDIEVPHLKAFLASEKQEPVICATPPQFLKEPEDHLGLEGKIADFSCMATGQPQPIIEWAYLRVYSKAALDIVLDIRLSGEVEAQEVIPKLSDNLKIDPNDLNLLSNTSVSGSKDETSFSFDARPSSIEMARKLFFGSLSLEHRGKFDSTILETSGGKHSILSLKSWFDKLTTIPEDLAVGRTIGTYTDPMVADYSLKPEYFLLDDIDEHFSLDSRQGILTLEKPLNREKKSSFSMTVRALYPPGVNEIFSSSKSERLLFFNRKGDSSDCVKILLQGSDMLMKNNWDCSTAFIPFITDVIERCPHHKEEICTLQTSCMKYCAPLGLHCGSKIPCSQESTFSDQLYDMISKPRVKTPLYGGTRQ
eukprot:UC4_evm1s1252